MSHDHDTPSKLEIATYALLPVAAMLFIEMLANHLSSPAQSIFISPYLLAFFTTCAIGLVVLFKGQICPGQKGRLTFVLPFLLLFALGNFAYSIGFTPKHSPALVVGSASLILPFILWRFPDDEVIARTIAWSGLGICAIGAIQYLLIYWVEIPSLLNWIRGNNFAQVQLGLLLAGWYMMLAKSRLEGFFKLLVQVALIFLILNYIWTGFVLYQQYQIMPDTPLTPFMVFFVVQFVIFALLAWLLLGKAGKNIKNPTAWTGAAFLAMLYPLTNIF